MMRRFGHTRSARGSLSEKGAVLPLVAIMMVMLMMFAALAVDLGAAWSERRQDQSAADAAAMAAAVEYVRGSPTDAEIVAIVKDFVERNIAYPATSPGWDECPDPTDGFIALAGTKCVSLKQASTLANDVLLKVRVPTQAVPTSFARIMGFDTIDVSAEAIARIEANPGVLGALPYAVPSGLAPGTEYCLGTPPAGLSRDVCEGSLSGNFGTIDSPEFKAEDDPWGTTGACDDTGPANARQERNSALGIDHFLRTAPPGVSPYDGQDTCVSAESTPAIIPYALLATKGEIKTDGFIGDGPFGSIPLPGRLRQGTGPFRDLRAKGNAGKTPIKLDNKGLWEYLEPTDLGDKCHQSKFTGSGTAKTTALLECLKDGTVKFSEALLDSPRFGLAPVIASSDISDLSPSSQKATNIVDFAPVFLQSGWFNCNAGSCTKWADDSGTLFDNFDPGEGTAIGCQVKDGTCEEPQPQPNLNGISVLLLTDELWLPDSLVNQFDDPGGFNVYLYR